MKSQQYRDEQKQREMSEIQAKKDHAREQVLIGTVLMFQLAFGDL